MAPWLIWIAKMIVLAVIQVAAYALMPKPKGPKPDSVKELDQPTAEAGKPIPVIFGEVTVKEFNYLWTGDKEYYMEELD